MSPVGLLFLLFLLVPLVEIYFLIKVGNLIGAIPTIALVVFTALLGAMLLRFQGLVTLTRCRQAVARGELPALEMLERVLLVFAGALLRRARLSRGRTPGDLPAHLAAGVP